MRFASVLQLFFLLCVAGAAPTHAQRAKPSALSYRAAVFPASTTRTGGISDSAQIKLGKTRKVLLGMAIGAAVGGGSAYYFAKRSCVQVCDDSAPVLVPTVLFSFLGGLTGGLVVHVSTRSANTPATDDQSPLLRQSPLRRGRDI